MASELDAFLGPRKDVGDVTTIVGLSDSESDPWQARARSEGPSAWRVRGNPITTRVAETLAADAELPFQETTIARDCRRVAVSLLEESGGDELLVLRAQERCRRSGSWRGLSLWVQKKSLIHEIHRIRAARTQFSELLAEDPVEDVDPLVACRKCGKLVRPEREADDCKGH